MNHLTYKQAVRKFGGVEKLRHKLRRIENALVGVKIFAEHQFNEEEPDDTMQDWLNIIFEYDRTDEGQAAFEKAEDDVETTLYKRGLCLVYECNGDGDGIIMSYRVKSTETETKYPMNEGSSTYYICMEEWLYPTESGRDFVEEYDTYEEALAKAKECCDSELYNFASATGCDPTRPEAFINKDGMKQGVCITCKDGLEEWWYAVKIIPVDHGLT